MLILVQYFSDELYIPASIILLIRSSIEEVYPCRSLLTLRWCEFTRKQVAWRVPAFSFVKLTFSPVPTSFRKHLVCLLMLMIPRPQPKHRIFRILLPLRSPPPTSYTSLH